jgi:NAD(P)-dependent dehydrogenase (short-subunit alcohol dehydrogenase family)
VIGMARTVGGLEDLADAIEAAGGISPTLAPLSLADEGGLQRLCLAIHERWGRLDLVVHAAAHAAPLAPAGPARREGLRREPRGEPAGHAADDRDDRAPARGGARGGASCM